MLNLALCVECGREFDLLNESDATEFAIGHDCEPDPNNPDNFLVRKESFNA
jgi:hypothetical protein